MARRGGRDAGLRSQGAQPSAAAPKAFTELHVAGSLHLGVMGFLPTVQLRTCSLLNRQTNCLINNFMMNFISKY